MEAGNRCYDKKNPEEINRKIIDHSSDFLLTYTHRSSENLVSEGINRRKIFVVGNPIFEVIKFYEEEINKSKIVYMQMNADIFKNQLTNNLISCPDICPAEIISVVDAVEPLLRWYPDIQSVFSQQTLPMQFGDETTVEAAQSSTLDLFDESSQCLLYLVTETIATGARQHLTEKVFKPICLQMPFILVGTYGSLAYLRSYGFQTFGDFWDESYDDESDDNKRIEKIAQVLKQLNELDSESKNKLFHCVHDVVEHNWNHFYHGGFEEILWQELTAMLDAIQQDFNS
jgi:hypothetical protein